MFLEGFKMDYVGYVLPHVPCDPAVNPTFVLALSLATQPSEGF